MLSRSQSLETATWLHSAVQDRGDWTARQNISVRCYLIIGKSLCYFWLLIGWCSLLNSFCATHLLLPPMEHLHPSDWHFCSPGLVFGHHYRSHLAERTLYGAGLGFCFRPPITVADFLCPFICPRKDLGTWKLTDNLRRTWSAKALMHSLITHSILKFA